MFAAIVLPLVLAATQSIAGSIDREGRDRPRLLDPTCEKLNFEYKRMRELSFYRETIFELRADGTLQERLALIFRGDYGYQKAADDATWDRFNNEAVYWQRFTSCTAKNIQGAVIYYATYHRDGHIAGAEVWVPTNGGPITKVVRRYPNDDRFFLFRQPYHCSITGRNQSNYRRHIIAAERLADIDLTLNDTCSMTKR